MRRGGRSQVSRPRLVRAFAAPAVTGSLAATLPPVAGSESGTVGTAASQLVVTTQPAGAVTGVAFTTQPVVRLRDPANANVAEAGVTVTAYLSSGSGSLGGTKTATTDANGVATFTNLSITGTGSHTVSFHTLLSAVHSIWSDDVQVDRSASYFEVDTAGGRFGRATDPASGSLAWKSTYQSGTQVSHGNLHLAFGRTPDPYMAPVYGPTLDFGEVTAEFDLRHTIGSPFTDKLFRCHVFAAADFSQAAQCHAWANGGTQLFLDPATGTNAAGTVITSGYNDFANLTFLGIATGTAGVFGATATTSKHIKIVTRLDAPGQGNGFMQQYVNGVLDAQALNLALVKSYLGYGINAAYFEAFTNTPNAQTYDRYFDNITVTGRARAVVAASSLTVSAGGGGTYPNQPVGYTVVFAHDFQAFPSGSNGEAGTDWLEDGGHSSNLTIVTDATAPVGDTNVLRTRFPSGLTGGDSPCNVTVDQQDSARRSTQYFCLDFKIEGTDYQNQATGTKFGFFAYGQSAAGAMNQSFLILVGPGSMGLQSAPNLELWQQGSIADRSLGANLASSAISVGAWHRLEMVMTCNTIGSSNGLLKIWVDGVQTHNYTNVVYRNSTDTLGLAGWKWQPYWGGTGGTKNRDDFIRLAHVYLSGA